MAKNSKNIVKQIRSNMAKLRKSEKRGSPVSSAHDSAFESSKHNPNDLSPAGIKSIRRRVDKADKSGSNKAIKGK